MAFVNHPHGLLQLLSPIAPMLFDNHSHGLRKSPPWPSKITTMAVFVNRSSILNPQFVINPQFNVNPRFIVNGEFIVNPSSIVNEFIVKSQFVVNPWLFCSSRKCRNSPCIVNDTKGTFTLFIHLRGLTMLQVYSTS
jgi:hypothetical protein